MSNDRLILSGEYTICVGGCIASGLFADGHLIKGTLKQHDIIYNGTFMDGRLHGDGIMVVNDKAYIGIFDMVN